MKRIILAMAAPLLLISCKKDDEKSGYFTGEQTSLYHGKVWSWVKMDRNGTPEQLGLALDEAALNTVTHEGGGSHSHDNNLIVPLHHKAVESTPYKFIMLNWNPQGHEPDGIYDIPHFDIHFYMDPVNSVLNYMDPVKLETEPAAGYIPSNHIAGHGVPMMGKHWIDITSPELSGQPFTQTFIYGSYDGRVVFYEPMITLDFLKNTNSFDRMIPAPARFQASGYYPTKMKVVRSQGTVNIILDGFVLRQAS